MNDTNGMSDEGLTYEDVEERAVAAGLLDPHPRWPWRLELRPGVLHHDAGRDSRRRLAAEQMGVALRGWRDLPGATEGGLRVGIVADPCTHTPGIGEYIADLAWILSRGLYESVATTPDRWSVHRTVVLAADPPRQPTGLARPHYARGLLHDLAVVFESLAEGVAVATHCATLGTPGGVRLLVLITGGHHNPASPASPAGGQVRRVPPGCGVLTLCPAAYDDAVGDRVHHAAATATDVAGGATDLVVLNAADPIPGDHLGTYALEAIRRATDTQR